MPPYFRFPEPGAINQRFWGCRPRNPTCGLISLETGTKVFLWGNMVYAACLAIACALLSLSPLFVGSSTSQKDIAQSLKDAHFHKDRMTHDDWVDKIHLKHTFGVLQALLFVSFIMFSTLWFISWKLKKAVNERDLAKLKKYYFCILLLLIVIFIPAGLETEMMWSAKAFLVDIPSLILEIMGLMFTHAFIVSLIAPENSQHDDLNRIQFNP